MYLGQTAVRKRFFFLSPQIPAILARVAAQFGFSMSKKRTLDSFFPSTSPVKKAKVEALPPSAAQPSRHPTYPWPVPQYPESISDALSFSPYDEGKVINDQPDLDLHYFAPYIPPSIATDVFNFLRQELFFYRVKYTIKRGPIETAINTPRFTTVFGLDETSLFSRVPGLENGETTIVDAVTKKPVPSSHYKCAPRPIPGCLDALRQLTEASTGCKYNFCLVNYYASGNDSISYHSDDERFLGVDPAIASFSLGAKRDFLMKHKPASASTDPKLAEAIESAKPLKLALNSGDMVLMRGRTQSNWLHSIPKRKGGESDKGRINITFRRAMVRGGTENYYRYNVGDGPPHLWDDKKKEMIAWAVEE